MHDAVALAALVDSSKAEPRVDRQWLLSALETHWRDFQAEVSSGKTRAWSVGGVHGLETLVQSRPVVRDRHADLIDDLVRVPSQCTLASFAVGAGQRPVPRLEISRFERWIGIQSEGLGGRVPGTLRDELRRQLPGFLTRSLRQGTDRELVLFSFLACLHELTGIGRTYASAADIRRALQMVDDRLGNPDNFHMVVADGRTTGLIHRGGTMVKLPVQRAKPPRRAITGPHPAVTKHPSALLLIHEPQPTDQPLDDSMLLPEGVFSVSTEAPVVLSAD